MNNGTLFLQRTDAKTYVPDWSQQINTISEYVNQIIVDEGNVDSNVESGEREEWMYLADLKMKSDNGNCKLMECPLDYNEDRLKYTVEEIGDMPYWIDTQKKAATLQIPLNSEPVKIENLRIKIENFNNEQRVAYQIVQNHFKSEGQKQLLMIITGLGGQEKAVIQALSELLDTQCKVCAFFGIAAFNIKGRTLHSLLQLPIKGRNNGPLKSSALAKLQHELL